MKIIYKLSFLILVITFACDESKLDQINPNQYKPEQYYIDGNQLTAATNAVYAQLLGGDLWGRNMQYFSDTRADEHASGGAQLEIHNQQLLVGTYSNSNAAISEAWRGHYKIIHRANAVIQNAPDIEDIADDVRKQRVAEARFLRAFGYYNLNAHWGRVPLYTEVVETLADTKGPAEESEIFKFLEDELKAIQEDLPWQYVDANLGRVTQGAVKLLLARVLMQQGKYGDARPYLLNIYDEGPYSLTPDYHANFRSETEYNQESIWEIGFAGGGYGWTPDANTITQKSTIMFQDYNPVGWRNMIPSEKLINEFENTLIGDAKTDPRMGETIIFKGETFGANNEHTLTVEGVEFQLHGIDTIPAWRKYSPLYKLHPTGYWESDINYRIMRYAEVLLKLAECENELDNIDEALDYLNEIRARQSVDMPAYPTDRYPSSTKEEVRETIMHEAMVEFANEKLRVLDLSRWRKNGWFGSNIPEPVGYIATDPEKAILPYPTSETDRNPNF